MLDKEIIDKINDLEFINAEIEQMIDRLNNRDNNIEKTALYYINFQRESCGKVLKKFLRKFYE